MIVTNQTTQDIYFGPLHLDAGVGQQLTIDDTSATSLYLLDDSVADAVNNAYNAGKITVSGQAQPFPRPTGDPQLLHGAGSPEGLVYAPQGSIYMRRDASSTFVLYVKTSGVTFNTNWVAVDTTGASVPTGSISAFAGLSAPAGWLVCDGSAVSRTTYTALFPALVTTKGTVTVTIASPAVLTLTNHGLVAGDIVYLETTGSLPTGLSPDTPYYVLASGLTTNTFQVSASPGGSAVNTSGSQSGLHTLYYAPYANSSMGSSTFTLPDFRGRGLWGFGAGTPTNSSLAANDNLALGSRRPAVNLGGLTNAFGPGGSGASQAQGQLGIEGFATITWIIKI